jgi:hypothetical protein
MFLPLFQATLYPETNPEIYKLLLILRGFDVSEEISEY